MLVTPATVRGLENLQRHLPTPLHYPVLAVVSAVAHLVAFVDVVACSEVNITETTKAALGSRVGEVPLSLCVGLGLFDTFAVEVLAADVPPVLWMTCASDHDLLVRPLTPAASTLSLMKRKLTGGEESSMSLTILTFGPVSCLRFRTTCFLRAEASMKLGRGDTTRMTGVVRVVVLVLGAEEVVAAAFRGLRTTMSELDELWFEDCLFLELVVVERPLDWSPTLVAASL